MKLKLKSRLLLYRFFSTVIGRALLSALSSGVAVSSLGNVKKKQKRQFFVVITTDTESGYVERDEKRVWQREMPEAFEGYYYGIRNLMRVFAKHMIKTTFFLSTQCFSSKGDKYKDIKKQLKELEKEGHEIGLHLHPDSDFALQNQLSRKFDETSAFFYNYKEKLMMIRAAKGIVKKNLGIRIAKKLISFRWGNWALDSSGARALNNAGFKIDSSAVPGIKGHSNDGMRYDWSCVRGHYPWILNVKNYQATGHNISKITEIPIATFEFFGINLRADPIYSVLLNKAFEEYYKRADRSKRPFSFVIMTHSSEATTKNGKSTQSCRDLDNFISFAKGHDNVEFITLRGFYRTIS